jgi:hypothetical protein
MTIFVVAFYFSKLFLILLYFEQVILLSQAQERRCPQSSIPRVQFQSGHNKKNRKVDGVVYWWRAYSVTISSSPNIKKAMNPAHNKDDYKMNFSKSGRLFSQQ